ARPPPAPRPRAARRALLRAPRRSRRHLRRERDPVLRGPPNLDRDPVGTPAARGHPPAPRERCRAYGRRVRAVDARARVERLGALGGERDRGGGVARERERAGGERRGGKPRQRGRDQRFHHRGTPPPAHCTRTRPRWLTITLRALRPAASVIVPLSALPTAVKPSRPRAGSAAKLTPAGRRRVSSTAPPRTCVSRRRAAASKRTSVVTPAASARPRASLSALATSWAAPTTRSVATSAGSRTRPSPATRAASERPASASSR